MNEIFDIIIVGAGPAGSTLARLASREYKVLLLDKKHDTAKCCGGLIAPDAQKILAGFDIGIPKSVLSDHQLFYVRSIDLMTGREGKYQRHYMNVNRKKFNEYLLHLIGGNAEIKKGCRYVKHEKTENGILVYTKDGNSQETYTCRLLIGADGAYSRVRNNEIHDFPSIQKYLAIQCEYRKTQDVNHYAVFFDSHITDFYSWLIPKEEKIFLGSAFHKKTKLKERFSFLEDKVRKAGYNIGEKEKMEACYIIRPRLKDICTGRHDVAFIGEAAGFISPSSAEGLSYAFKSAVALYDSIKNTMENWETVYRWNTLPLKAKIFLKTIKGNIIYNRLLRNIIFKTGIFKI